MYKRQVFAAAPGAGLAVFTETAVFSLRHKRKVYLDWSRHSWGYDCDPAYETYDSLPPVNLGVVLGDPPSVLAALERLVCDLEACGGWDQFVFSKLVYTTEKARVYTTDDGPVADPRRAAPTLCDSSAAPGAGREPVLEPRGARGRRGRGAQRRRAALRPRPPVGPLRRARRARRGAVPLRRRVGPLSPAGDGDGEEVRGDDDGAAEVGPGGVREGGEVAGLVARREVPERERRRSRGVALLTRLDATATHGFSARRPSAATSAACLVDQFLGWVPCFFCSKSRIACLFGSG